MTFSSAVKGTTVFGNKNVNYGTWTSGSTSGGDVATGLTIVEMFIPVAKGSSVTTNGVVVNETLPLNNVDGKVTIVTDSAVDGYWVAIGV
jgi:hypothetical protein